MKKVATINISSQSFFIDEDAFDRLDGYLKKLGDWFRPKEGGKEIIADIESRIRELFEQKIEPSTGVITLPMVEEVIGIMGQPEDFEEDADAEEQTRTAPGSPPLFTPPRRRLYRDVENSVLGGVCSGIAAYFNLDPVLVRIIFAILPFLSFGVIIPIYIVLWIAIPPAVTTAQKLEMRGENITISNIEKTIKEEYEEVKKKFGRFKESPTYKKGESYIRNLRKRDRTVLIIVGVVVFVLLLGRGLHLPFNYVSIPPMNLHFPFFSWHFPGLFTIVILLLVMGLIFKTAMKGFLWLIVILLVGAALIKLFGFIIPVAFYPLML